MFINIQELGQGEHGKVYKCVRKMDLWPYAVKVLNKMCSGRKDRERVLQEIYALSSQGDNPFALRYYNAWEEQDVIYIQTELCLKTLHDEWVGEGGQLPFQRLATALYQAASGLAYLHEHGMAHLDMKPANLYLSLSGRIKIGDFGHVKVVEPDRMASRQEVELLELGDRRYVAPELLDVSSPVNLNKCDVFSLGASIYELACVSRLPESGSEFTDVRRGSLAHSHQLPPDLRELVESMMDPDPARRPSAQQVVNLSRPLLQDDQHAADRLLPRAPSALDAALRNMLLESRAKLARAEEKIAFMQKQMRR
uniref:Protein kinase domain-containing protein n=1 Tax=Guillardia theta (strain CCMP2712) TaxID=905079 RepID=A0A0C3SZM2_GUITC